MASAADGEDWFDVSIIVPVYNIENYLDRCLDSLSDLSGLRAEIICVNDGSTDASLAVLERHARANPNIRVITQANAGCAAARQTGVDAARGAFVGFVDGDDWITPGMFQALHRAACRHGADVAMGSFVKEFESTGESSPVVETIASYREVEKGSGWVSPHDVARLSPAIWRKIFRRAFLIERGIHFHAGIPRFDDLLFNAQVMFHGPSVLQVEGPPYHYRLERPGQTMSHTDERMFVHFPIFEAMSRTCAEVGGIETERSFRAIQIATHSWIATVLDEPLRSRYRLEAAKDIFGRKMRLNRDEIIEVANGISPRMGRYAGRLSALAPEPPRLNARRLLGAFLRRPAALWLRDRR